MNVRVQVLEYCRAPVKDGVIRGVKIIGTKSRNGRTYPVEVLRAAKPLYEGTAVYMFHPSDREKRKGSRQLDDHIGHLMNIRERGDGADKFGLFGDLHIKQSHPMAGLILENLDKPIGMSHNAVCDMNDEETEVLKIFSVNSVDLVDHPATNENLFESEELDEMSIEEITKAQAATDAKVDALTGKLDTVLEAIQKKPEPTRMQALEAIKGDAGDGDEAPSIGNSHDAFLDVVRGFSTIDTKGAQA